MKIVGNITFIGKKFSPSEAEELIDLSFSEKNEVNEIGVIGRYKGKPYDYGASTIYFDQFPKSSNDFLLVPFELIKFLNKHRIRFKEIGVENINLSITICYENQCNLEIEPELMKELSSMEVTLEVSCYRDNSVEETK